MPIEILILAHARVKRARWDMIALLPADRALAAAPAGVQAH